VTTALEHHAEQQAAARTVTEIAERIRMTPGTLGGPRLRDATLEAAEAFEALFKARAGFAEAMQGLADTAGSAGAYDPAVVSPLAFALSDGCYETRDYLLEDGSDAAGFETSSFIELASRTIRLAELALTMVDGRPPTFVSPNGKEASDGDD
jgi:hypothetical protein